MDVAEELAITVTVIPEGRSAETFAYGNRVVLGIDAEEEMKGRELVVQADASNTPDRETESTRALARGDVVVVLSVRDAEEETMTVILPQTGRGRERALLR